MKTNIYVDTFNLYYGSLKNTPYRWLDIRALCNSEFPDNAVNRIRCFSAIVKARPNDLTKPERQAAYFRALRTIPGLTIHLGQFLDSQVRMPYVNPPVGGPTTALVKKTEEKGSDVNLASYLLLDAFREEFEAAIVISNDSDLVEPIRLVRKELGLKVVVLLPCNQNSRPSVELRKVATKHKIIDVSSLASSQLPNILHDANGTIRKPLGW